MLEQPYSFLIGELTGSASGWKKRIVPKDSLKYCPASAGDWGIIRVGLLVPESALLFIAPSGCGRHGAIAGLQKGFSQNLFFLCISEAEIVAGSHLDKIPGAVEEILEFGNGRFKALQLCATCVDTLLASDYESLAADLGNKTDIPVHVCYMNPITMDSKTPPPFTVQKAIYDFLKPVSKKRKAVNFIGGFAGVMEESEIHTVFKKAGLGEVKHVDDCSTFEEFLDMADSLCNILIKPGGKLAVADMKKRLGIPFIDVPLAYGLTAIATGYQIMQTRFQVSFDIQGYYEKAQEAVKTSRKKFGKLRLAVGQSINAGSFELARALTEFDFDVRYIFSDIVIDSDQEHVKWLQEHAPHIIVYTNAHTSMVNFIKQKLEVDLAIGFDAAYYCSGAKVVPLDLGIQAFGYQAVEYLLSEMELALADPTSLKDKMYASGLVI